MNFYAGRISLLQIQNSLFYNHRNERKLEYIIAILSRKIEFNVRKGVNIIIQPVLDEDGTLLGGKIARRSKMKLPLLHDGTLEKISTEIYPYIFFIFDENEQVILFEKNCNVFSNELVVFKYLINYLNRELFYHGLEIDIKPLTVKGIFWNLLESLEKVYSINFSLKAPNFLGKSYKDLSGILRKEKEMSNANQVEYGISNANGELMITDKGNYEAAIGWIEDGAGEWKIKAKPSGKGKRRRTYKNSEQLTLIDIEVELHNDDIKNIKHIRRRIDLGKHKINKGELYD